LGAGVEKKSAIQAHQKFRVRFGFLHALDEHFHRFG
jgi:hypothetical protein